MRNSLIAALLLGTLLSLTSAVTKATSPQAHSPKPSYVAGIWDCGRICVDGERPKAKAS